jgi:hypothetical protein
LPPREWDISVYDMIGAVDKILSYTSGMDKAAFAAIAPDLDAELITADRGFARFAGLRWRHPFAGTA